MNSPSPDLRARILAEASARPTRTRRARRVAFWLTCLGSLAAVLALASMHGARGLQAHPFAYNTLSLGAFVLVIAWLCAPLRAYRSSPLGPGRQRVLGRALVAPALLALGVLLGNALAPEVEAAHGNDLEAHLRCFCLTAWVGGGVATLGIVFMRGTDPLAPRALGALLGALSGSAAALAMSIACTRFAPFHVLGSHVLTVLVVTAGGSVWGARALRVPEPRQR